MDFIPVHLNANEASVSSFGSHLITIENVLLTILFSLLFFSLMRIPARPRDKLSQASEKSTRPHVDAKQLKILRLAALLGFFVVGIKFYRFKMGF